MHGLFFECFSLLLAYIEASSYFFLCWLCIDCKLLPKFLRLANVLWYLTIYVVFRAWYYLVHRPGYQHFVLYIWRTIATIYLIIIDTFKATWLARCTTFTLLRLRLLLHYWLEGRSLNIILNNETEKCISEFRLFIDFKLAFI